MNERHEGKHLRRQEAKKRWKTILAVFLSVVLVMQSSNIQAFADVLASGGSEGRDEVVMDPAAEDTGTQGEVTTPEETDTTDEQASSQDDAEQTVAETEENPVETTAQDTEATTPDGQSDQAQSEQAPAEETDTTVTLNVEVSAATLKYSAQDGTEKSVTSETDPKSVDVSNTLDFTFTVAPDDGQRVSSVAYAGTELAANDSGEYTIAAADLTDGEKIVVTTEAVPTEEPAEDATPVEPEDAVESTEDANKSEAATSSNGISTMSISGPSTVAVGDSVELEGDGGWFGWDHSWSAQPRDGVEIDENGSSATVMGTNPGTVTITHTYTWGFGFRETETFTLTVIRGLSVTIDDNSIEAGSTTTARAEGATGSVKWESSNPSVAQVTQTGRVIGVSEGTVRITATDFTGATGSVSVRVTPMMCTITFDLNGGQWSGNDGLKEGANEREFGSQLWSSGDLASPTRDGYYFTGWTPTVSKTVVGDATYRANWERISDYLTPVYVYTKVDGTEEDKEGLILNNEGWYTLGVIFVPSWLCDPDAPQNTTVDLNSSYNMGQIERALNGITAYLPNASLLEYIDEIDWTKLHVQNGANDYVPSGPEVRPVSSWHLDGELDASRLAT